MTVMDAAMLTDSVKSDLFEATVENLDNNEFVDAIASAIKFVDKGESFLSKLVIIARYNFLFGYMMALSDYQEIQLMLIDAAKKGELEDDSDG